MEKTSKELLHLEHEIPVEPALLICKNAPLTSQLKKTNPRGQPITAPLPPSQVEIPPRGDQGFGGVLYSTITRLIEPQVLGKVKDFLGVLSEANKRLQVDAKDNIENYDIEVLSGNESQIIEMDLMLGIADLHTPEAVAAAESAVAAGHQPIESDDSSDEDDGDSDYISNDHDEETSAKDNSSNEIGRNKSKRQSKIIDMDICKQVIAEYYGALDCHCSFK
ncbi:uncharacterized protein LOC133795587 [Humulus lupulus]|uniref:uncharacterized protein LOC133795587 n=1 Tax=Humulus lupulus TaxID=3486 RepID=UPI002B416311|nr:uncharacterized protein LOC133795587 [Humulus lupulus]